MSETRAIAIEQLTAIASDATVDAAVRVRAAELLLELPDGADEGAAQNEDPNAETAKEATVRPLHFRASGGLVPRVRRD